MSDILKLLLIACISLVFAWSLVKGNELARQYEHELYGSTYNLQQPFLFTTEMPPTAQSSPSFITRTSQDITNFLNRRFLGRYLKIKDIPLALILSFGLSLIIGKVYQKTHSGAFYSQAHVHTMIIVSMVVSVIMLVIGSSIARAFALLGAMSIIRFRNAVKDIRDLGYLFFAMTVGIACGTGSYAVAMVSTVVISLGAWLMHKMNFFAANIKKKILKIRLPGDIQYNTLFKDVFDRYLWHFELITVETVQAGILTELVYKVELKSQDDIQEFMEALCMLNDNNKVVLMNEN